MQRDLWRQGRGSRWIEWDRRWEKERQADLMRDKLGWWEFKRVLRSWSFTFICSMYVQV